MRRLLILAAVVIALLPGFSGTAQEQIIDAFGCVPPALPALPGNPFDLYLLADVPVADGFDFPVGDADGRGAYTSTAGATYPGWRVSTHFLDAISVGTHPGEDFNGTGGGNTDLGQPVHALAAGRVVVAEDHGPLWGNVVVIEHLFYENHHKRRIRSLYAHLGELRVGEGDDVIRRQTIGAIGQDPDRVYWAHLHLELRWDLSLPTTHWPVDWSEDQYRAAYAEPSRFIAEHRQLFVPQEEDRLVLVDHASYRMRLYQDGDVVGAFPISLGQGEGRKRRFGDDRTPKGMYFVVRRHRGEFSGEWADYFGGHWLKINYPNPWDAAFGREQGWITTAQEQEITSVWQQRELTLSDTKLGKGIGFHGWVEDWSEDGPRHLSWGCIVMQNDDIARVWDDIQNGTMVVIF
jgi:murein DD-endopeptidase MepM/ murein hydrolase activator NlpD